MTFRGIFAIILSIVFVLVVVILDNGLSRCPRQCCIVYFNCVLVPAVMIQLFANDLVVIDLFSEEEALDTLRCDDQANGVCRSMYTIIKCEKDECCYKNETQTKRKSR